MKNTHTQEIILHIFKYTLLTLFIVIPFTSIAQNATSNHNFDGKWITTPEFSNLEKTNVFHRQLDKQSAKRVRELAKKIQNRHILFRKIFHLNSLPKNAKLFFSADDYAKIYINGKFVAMGPTAGYHFIYFYHEVDVSKFLKQGKNTIAVHSYYQGYINRVWVSGDYRHGFICDIISDNKTLLKTDDTWKYAIHTAFSDAKKKIGYETQFAEHYDASATEVNFQFPNYDDSTWQNAQLLKNPDYTLKPSPLPLLVFENIKPVKIKQLSQNKIFIDFGAMYVGYFEMSANGKKGDTIETRFAQELNEDGSIRYKTRANCTYQEYFTLSGKTDILNQYDFKSFRYAEIIFPKSAKIDNQSFKLIARHMPFKLKAKNKYQGDKKAEQVWNLCVRSLQYGVQEQIQDCM
ncbi:MAG: family 78 glycoside hydrolase catalytic domain, partial [Opitutales bacterium]|nr:family 78 glycoside hydrolase catalytic domain [Opitutales bacterium]